MSKEVNIFNLGKKPRGFNDQSFAVNLIEDLINEHLELDSKCESESENSNINREPKIQSSTEQNVAIDHLKYAHLGGKEIFPSTPLSRFITTKEKNLSHREISGLTITTKGLSLFLIKYHNQLRE